MKRRIPGLVEVPGLLMEEFTRHRSYNSRLNVTFQDFYKKTRSLGADP